MQDMLALHRLPPAPTAAGRDDGVVIRATVREDEPALRSFVTERFESSWVDGVSVVFSRDGAHALVAILDDRIVGFALWNIAYRGYFGPIGVDEEMRGRGIGSALLLRALDEMQKAGYAYAIIGKVGPVEFYEKVCGARLIAGDPAP